MLYIRTDMNEVIATGHIMRCLAIADAAKELGKDTTFILADTQAVGLIRERGYHTIVLDTKWNDMDAELGALRKVIEECGITSLLVDSYMVTQNYLQVMAEWTEIAYIDDLNAFFYPVHTLICYANYWKKFEYEKRYNGTKLLLGLQYVPLRKVFINCEKKIIKPKVEKLLLLSGGTDNFNILDSLLRKIDKKKYQSIDVIYGKYYAEYEQICCRYRQYENVYFHKAVNDIEHYMKNADIVVSAGGTTLYELCACGTPAISYSFADNQLDNVHQFQEDGMIDYAGDVRFDKVIENIIYYLDKYQGDMQLRQQRSREMQKLVDGNGALRIVEALKDI